MRKGNAIVIYQSDSAPTHHVGPFGMGPEVAG
jgi:hypothetical protein